MIKSERIHHSITENGNLQVRLVTQYKEDDGSLVSEKYGEPMAPADHDNMTEWDSKSKAIMKGVRSPATQAAFGIEKSSSRQHPSHKPKSGVFQSRSFDRVIDDDGKIAVRRIDRVFDDGVEISKKFHRSWIMPGDDTSDADVISKAIAAEIHTTEVIDAYKVKINHQEG